MIESLVYAKLPPHLKRSTNLAFVKKTSVTLIAVNLIGTLRKTFCHSTNTSQVEHSIKILIPHFDLRFESHFNCSHEQGSYTQMEEPTEEAVCSI